MAMKNGDEGICLHCSHWNHLLVPVEDPMSTCCPSGGSWTSATSQVLLAIPVHKLQVSVFLKLSCAFGLHVSHFLKSQHIFLNLHNISL